MRLVQINIRAGDVFNNPSHPEYDNLDIICMLLIKTNNSATICLIFFFLLAFVNGVLSVELKIFFFLKLVVPLYKIQAPVQIQIYLLSE